MSLILTLLWCIIIFVNKIWGTSSMDRVADFESVGWGFESLVPHQRPLQTQWSFYFS